MPPIRENTIPSAYFPFSVTQIILSFQPDFGKRKSHMEVVEYQQLGRLLLDSVTLPLYNIIVTYTATNWKLQRV